MSSDRSPQKAENSNLYRGISRASSSMQHHLVSLPKTKFKWIWRCETASNYNTVMATATNIDLWVFVSCGDGWKVRHSLTSWLISSVMYHDDICSISEAYWKSQPGHRQCISQLCCRLHACLFFSWLAKYVNDKEAKNQTLVTWQNDKEVRNQTLIPRQVRVAVKSSSYNPVDSKTRNGGPGREVKLPKVPGGDLAGLVVESDSDSRVSIHLLRQDYVVKLDCPISYLLKHACSLLP